MTNKKKDKKKNPRPKITESILADLRRTPEGTMTHDGYTVLADEFLEGGRRWVNMYRKVFTDNNSHFWAFYYEVPKTEYQDGSENELTLDDVHKVKLKKKTVIYYE